MGSTMSQEDRALLTSKLMRARAQFPRDRDDVSPWTVGYREALEHIPLAHVVAAVDDCLRDTDMEGNPIDRFPSCPRIRARAERRWATARNDEAIAEARRRNSVQLPETTETAQPVSEDDEARGKAMMERYNANIAAGDIPPVAIAKAIESIGMQVKDVPKMRRRRGLT